MDTAAATAALKKVGAAGAKAGDEVAAGSGKAEKGLRGAKAGADSFGSSVAGLMKAQMSLAAIKQTASAIGGAFNDTAKYVQEMAKEFQALRKTMQEVATLKGVANSNKFTVDEAEKAQKAHLSPAEMRDFQAQFMNYAGSQVGGPNGKLTEVQGEEYASRVAELMKSSGVDPAVGAELAGSLLENSKGPQDVNALMQKLGRTFNVLEKGRVPLKQALPQISQIMGHGISSEESAKLFSIVSPAAPGQEGNAVESALKAIEEMKVAGSGAAFGVKRGMGQYESIKAFSENINARKEKMVAGGKTEQEAEDEIAAQLKQADVAADVRERRGLVRGFGRQGVQLGGFKTYEDIEKNTPADFEASRKKRYEESEQGRQDAVDNALAVEQAKLGERNDKVAKWRKIAETELTAGGAFEHVQPGAETAARLPGASDARTIQINQQAIRRARGMLGEQSGIGDSATAVNQGLTDDLLRQLLKRLESIDNNTRKANAEKAAQAGGIPNAMKPPQPAGREGGG
jgi:hypothetical protein